MVKKQRTPRRTRTDPSRRPTAAPAGAPADPVDGVFVVRGQVRDRAGNVVPHGAVRVYDKDLRSEELLGEAKIDRTGRYEFQYTADQFARAEKGHADLRVAVVNVDGLETASSEVLFHAPAEAEINLTVPTGDAPTEFETYVATLQPVLQGLAIADLKEDAEHQDFSFLSPETGIDRRHLEWLVSAHRAANGTTQRPVIIDELIPVRPRERLTHGRLVLPQPVVTVPPEAFYALFRQGLTTDIEELAQQPFAAIAGATEQSIQMRIVPASTAAYLEVLRVLLGSKAVARLLEPAAGDRSSIGGLLSAALPPDLAKVVAAAYLDRRVEGGVAGDRQVVAQSLELQGEFEPMLGELERAGTVSEKDIKRTKGVLALDRMAGGHMPLVREMSLRDRGMATDGDLRSMARVSESEWIEILRRPREGGREPIGHPPEFETDEAYARTLKRTFEREFPTEALAHRIGQPLAAASPFKRLQTDLTTFFKNNPDFKLGESAVGSYLAENESTRLRDVRNKSDLKTQLTTMDRIAKIASRFEEMEALLADGIHSAQGMVLLGEEEFKRRYGKWFGGEEPAGAAFGRANDVTFKALGMYMKFGMPSNAPLPYVLDTELGGTVDISRWSPADRATWRSLFGSLDLCACTECQSLYGPAAYFVDLLLFLRQQGLSDGRKVVDALFERRPDLAHVELSCDNTNIKLPYIDLLNEILEQAVGGPTAELLGDFAPADFDAGVLAPEIVQALGLTSRATLAKNVAGSSWTIRDRGARFGITMNEPRTGVLVRTYPQTSGTEQELATNPEHAHAQAYDTLARAAYPWSLPFHLPIEQARVYLRQLGVERWQLMEAMTAPGTQLSQDVIAAEYLGLAPDEAGIIGGTIARDPGRPPTGQTNEPWTFWGFAQQNVSVIDPATPELNDAYLTGPWHVVLRRVAVLLQQSGLAYTELLELVDTYFLNPPAGSSRTLSIRSIDANDPATCNLAQLEIQGLTPELLDRMQRFVRLKRALGWSARELDRAITAIGGGALTSGFLRRLSHIQRLNTLVGLPVVTLLSFWADIDRRSYNIGTGKAPVEPSLYATLFRNRSVGNPGDASFTENPDNLTGTLADHVPTVLGALRISAADFAVLTSGPTAVTTGGALTLANLSALHRHAVLGRSLQLSMSALLQAKTLFGVDPFAGTEEAVRFIERVKETRARGFDVDALAVLLRHESTDERVLARTDDQIGRMLEELRGRLRRIDEETAAAPDPVGALTRAWLAQLAWPETLIEQVVALAADQVEFTAPLGTLPAGVTFPPALGGRIEHDASRGLLKFSGVMSTTTRAELRNMPFGAGADPAPYYLAIETIFRNSWTAAKAFISDRMRAFELPVFSAPAGTGRLLQPVAVPEQWRTRLRYDTASGKLSFAGPMTDAELVELRRLSTATDFRTALQSLFDQAKTYSPQTGNRFLIFVDPGDPATDPARTAFTQLFDAGLSVAGRFDYLTARLSEYLRRTQNEAAVRQYLTDGLQIEAAITGALLSEVLRAPSGPPRLAALQDLVDPGFVQSSGAVSRPYYPHQFAVLTRMRKVAAVVAALRLTAAEVTWVATHHAQAGWMDWNDLPAGSSDPAVSFDKWQKLIEVFALRRPPFVDASVVTHLVSIAHGAAGKDVFLQALSEASGWGLGELTALAGGQTTGDGGLLNLAYPAAYRDGTAIGKLMKCFELLDRLGASSTQLADWSRPGLVADGPPSTTWPDALANAAAVKNAVRSKHADREWLTVAKPIANQLRDRQRSALVDYLVAARTFGRDETELYERFLIDVEMSSCMTTTRIRQAACSIQLFVQRVLMNLEPGLSLTPEAAKEWNSWRRVYRVWEAHRRIFLHPESFMVPSLRDDKSPFFKELENELLQNDVNDATAEAAVRGYLERLEQVARLEIVGLCVLHEPADTTKTRGTIHMFGRTAAIPHIYFYRQMRCEKEMLDGVWTPWEKVDLDIEGDHLIPVVWNGHVRLYWPIFVEKTERTTKEQRARDEEPPKYWEIKLAWSELRNGKWQPRKLSRTTLKHYMDPSPLVPQETKDFRFIDWIQTGASGNRLMIDCYGTVVTPPPPPPPPPPPAVPPPERLLLTVNKEDTVHIHVTISDQRPRDSELAKTIEIAVKDPDDSDFLLGTLKAEHILFDIGVRSNPDLLNMKRRSFYYKPSDAFAFRSFTMRDSPPFTKVGVLDLAVVAAPAETGTPMTEAAQASPDYTRMRAIGRFVFDDCRGDSKVLSLGAANPAILPNVLEPLPGTQFSGMMTEEQDYRTEGADPFGSAPVLARTPGRFRVLTDSHLHKSVSIPLVFQDDTRTYVVRLAKAAGGPWSGHKARFNIHFHPMACTLIETLNARGVESLLSLATQSVADEPSRFEAAYAPNAGFVDLDQPGDVARRTPREDIDFSRQGAYSIYNWELFFHVPLLIATELSKNQKFDEARRWFHFIFDPTTTVPGGRERFWQVKPLRDEAMKSPESLEELLKEHAEEWTEQVDAWKAHPFQPFVIARLRRLAFMKNVVMRYIDNLIAWGDMLFTRDTIESINEATQLYILAAQILGPKPERIPSRARPEVQTFETVGPSWPDGFFSTLVEIESYVFPSTSPAGVGTGTGTGSLGTMPLFCMPPNEELLECWDTVALRLFRIRHCMNIEGVERALAVYDPRIDPMLLVRAAAAGVDLNSVLNDLYAPLPHYRFSTMMQRASELCGEVRSLGGSLLSALEKKDAEQLAYLRSDHEVALLREVRRVKQQQVAEARSTLDGLFEFEKVVTARQQFYLSREYMNAFESAHANLTAASLIPATIQISTEIAAGVLNLIPDTKTGAPTTMGLTYGGSNIGAGLQSFGGAMGATSSLFNTLASLSSTMAGYRRRQDDWTHQAELATKELEQVKKQIAAAEIRLAIAESELENHDTQAEQSREVNLFMREKYTNTELYSWMTGQLSALYFQTYKLAYNAARRAERSYRLELGLADSNFVQFGYWDSLRKGLLAGEQMHLDLRRLEADYFEKNKREYEITKHISLRQLDAEALIALRATGECEFELPEALFDLDFAGHYFRRIRNVSISVPSVVGPYTGVTGTLRLLSSKVREKSSTTGSYADEENYKASFVPVQSVATSSGQNDSGLFELNFRDERYLPFEGAGIISRWRFILPREFRAFDYETISDLIMHVRYTARDGGSALADGARGALATSLNALVHSRSDETGLMELISLRQDFPVEWQRYRDDGEDLELQLTERLFPYMLRARVKPERAAIVWKGQSRPLVLQSPGAAGLPKYVVGNGDNLELQAAHDPYLIVTYKV